MVSNFNLLVVKDFSIIESICVYYKGVDIPTLIQYSSNSKFITIA